MLSFNQLQEKKSKIKINPKKEDVMEGSCGSYSKGGEVKKNHGEDCDCTKCDKKRRKEDLGDEKTVSTEALAYDSQEEVSEEGNQEIAETETKTLLTFEELQYAKTLNEEQLQEFLKGLFGGGSKVPNTATPSPSQRAVGALQNQARQGNLMGSGMIANTAQKMLNRRDQQAAMMKQLLGRSKGGPVKKKVKKEEVELVNEMPYLEQVSRVQTWVLLRVVVLVLGELPLMHLPLHWHLVDQKVVLSRRKNLTRNH